MDRRTRSDLILLISMQIFLLSFHLSRERSYGETGLASYFQKRLVGPPSLDKKEKLALVRWCESFPERLSEMVHSLSELPPPELEFHQLYRLLDEEHSLPASDGLAELLLWILKGQRKEQFHGYYCEQLRSCLERPRGVVDNQLYRKLVERYSELGCSDPSTLLQVT